MLILAVDVQVAARFLCTSPITPNRTLLLLLVLARLAPRDLTLILRQSQTQRLAFNGIGSTHHVLLLRAVVMEHAAMWVLLCIRTDNEMYLRQIRVLHEGVARGVVHDEGEG